MKVYASASRGAYRLARRLMAQRDLMKIHATKVSSSLRCLTRAIEGSCEASASPDSCKHAAYPGLVKLPAKVSKA